MNPVNLLKNVMQKNIDDIVSFNPKIAGPGAENIGKMFNERFGDARISKEAFEGIQRNIDDFGLDASTATQEQLFKGVSGASQYKGNFITQAFNTDGGSGFGGALMGAGLGMAGAAAVGADAREGAVFGAMAGFGAAATGRAIMKNAGSIEENFMNSLLKNQTIRGGGELIPESLEDVAKRAGKDNVENLTVGDIQRMGYGEKPMEEFFGPLDAGYKFKNYDDYATRTKANPKTSHVDVASQRLPSDKFMDDIAFSGVNRNAVTETPVMQSVTSRSGRLEEVAKLTGQQVKEAGFGGEFKRDVLAGTKDLNVAQYTRMTGAIGSALTGMGFSAKRRDHRRGFNSKRGNRV